MALVQAIRKILKKQSLLQKLQQLSYKRSPSRIGIIFLVSLFFIFHFCFAKMSEFSIDYILNRAGNKYVGTNGSMGAVKRGKVNAYYHPYMNGNSHTSIDMKLNVNMELAQQLHESLEQIPVFDWLQYTRYHPPKLPRSLRQVPTKRTPGRLPRIPFSSAQLQALETAYKDSNYLSAEDANKLAESLDLTNTRVKIWFQNRRARERRERRERDESCDSTLSSTPSSPEPEIVDVE